MTTPSLKYSLLFTSLVLVSPAGFLLPVFQPSFSVSSLRPSSPSCPLMLVFFRSPMPSSLFILHILTEQLTPISSIKFHILMTLKSIFLTQASLMSSIPINWLMRHLCLDNLEAFHLNLSKAKPFILPFILYLLFSEWYHHLLIAKSET